MHRVDIDGGAIVYYAISTTGMTEEQLSWFVDDTINKRLLALSGVAGDSDLTRASALIIGGRNVLHIAHAIVDTLYFDARHIATG